MTTAMHRRDLIMTAAGVVPLALAGRAFATPPGAPRLLVVFLSGAYDAANVVAPTASSFYHEARPHIGLKRPDPADPDAALALDADWSLHPALKATLYPLWSARQLAFVPFAGIDDFSRSHFETQAAIEVGQPPDGPRDGSSGFMGRLARQLTGVKPIAFCGQMPLIFRGGPPIPNIDVAQSAGPDLDAHTTDLIQRMYQGGGLASAVSEGFRVQDQVYAMDAQMSADPGAVSARGFELAARRMGRMMRADYGLAYVNVTGWDTHANQGGADGYLALRLGELGRGLSGLVQELGPQAWNDTTVVVISEFGRTFRQNGSGGTDHGHGTTYWVLGGSVVGGRLAGEQVKIEQAALNQDRDFPVLNEYRAVLGGLFQRLYGLSPTSLEAVFPGGRPRDLGLV